MTYRSARSSTLSNQSPLLHNFDLANVGAA